MSRLMKYELRKTMFSKLVLLAVVAAAELIYLAGVFLKWDDGLAWGTLGLAFSAVIGIFYIGIESLLILHKDLNTKQSYMLFLTPQNSYQVLGAKVLENGISIFLTGAFFAVLTAVDVSIGILYIGGLEEFLDLLQELAISLHIEIASYTDAILMTFFATLASWLLMIVTGYLAIILSATVLAGKKLSGLVSFLLYVGLVWVSGAVMNLIPEMDNLNLHAGLVLGVSFVLIAIMYLISGWIMERKLSV